MAQERLSLRKIREVLRLKQEVGLSNPATTTSSSKPPTQLTEALAPPDASKQTMANAVIVKRSPRGTDALFSALDGSKDCAACDVCYHTRFDRLRHTLGVGRGSRSPLNSLKIPQPI